MLLSATVGDTAIAGDWLEPCGVVATCVRHPPLERTVLSLDDSDDAGRELAGLCHELLSKPGNSVLNFGLSNNLRFQIGPSIVE